MTKKKKTEEETDAKKEGWSTGAKVGVGAAAVGSAALVAALLYANKKRKDKTIEPQSPNPKRRKLREEGEED